MTAFEMEYYYFAIANAETLGQEIRKGTQFKKGEIKRLDEVKDVIQEKNDKNQKTDFHFFVVF